MDADQFIAINYQKLVADHRDHSEQWELLFAEQVLTRVRGLDFANVNCQTELRDVNGRRRRIDFTLSEPGVRVALEVDGFNKTGGGPMDRKAFVDWCVREQAIVTNGWRLLRFANTMVRDNPGFCARSIERTLALERELAARLRRAETEAQRVAARLADAEKRVLAAERKFAEALVYRESAMVTNLRTELEKERASLRQALAATAGAVMPGAEASDVTNDALRRDQALQSIQRDIEKAKKETQVMKFMAAAMAVVMITVAVIVVALTSGDTTAVPSAPPAAAASDEAPRDQCTAENWQDAKDRVGSSGTFVGRVVTATYRARSSGQPTFLNIGAPYGDDRRLVVLIWGRNRSKFPKAPERAYDDQRIAVTGKVTEYRGVAQVEIQTPSAIERCD